MTAQESLQFGIIDRIVERRAKDETESGGEVPGVKQDKEDESQ